MKLHVLFDRAGKILAAVQLDDRPEDGQAAPLPRPVAQRGQYTADVAVPAAFRGMSFLEVCTGLKVKGRDRAAELVAAGPAKRTAANPRSRAAASPAASRKRRR